MPLSKKGEEILKKFEEEYGFNKGKEVFYAKENKDKKFRELVKK